MKILIIIFPVSFFLSFSVFLSFSFVADWNCLFSFNIQGIPLSMKSTLKMFDPMFLRRICTKLIHCLLWGKFAEDWGLIMLPFIIMPCQLNKNDKATHSWIHWMVIFILWVSIFVEEFILEWQCYCPSHTYIWKGSLSRSLLYKKPRLNFVIEFYKWHFSEVFFLIYSTTEQVQVNWKSCQFISKVWPHPGLYDITPKRALGSNFSCTAESK